MPEPLRAVLVDDESLARERLTALLAEVAPEVEIAGEAASGREAVPLIHDRRPDVVFLDIAMPVLDGFDVVDLLAPPRPHIVFVTAYDEHALRAFEVHALDYLTKPVRAERLAEAVRRVQQARQGGRGADALDSLRASREDRPIVRLTVRVGTRLRVVDPREVAVFEARDKLVFARLGEREHPVDFTLDTLEARLPSDQFVRAHRAFLVNVAHIREWVPWFGGTHHLRLGSGVEIPVSRRRARAVRSVLKGE
ncbi:MAG: LytTR family DNA-binding domain-containing protein [Bacteroidota bacterium]